MADKLSPGDKVCVLTSGGDAPGMNSALRGLARVGAELGLEMVGAEDGYEGLLAGRFVPLDIRALDEASRRGGTALGTARSARFRTPEGQETARRVIREAGIAALVVIGGNGSLTGAAVLEGCDAARGPLRVAGLPASIDNDLGGTSMAIGVDTAMNTIVEACDRICDTARAHRRVFLVEVMGRDCGYLAMTAGVSAGADTVLVPESDRTEEELVAQVCHTIERAHADGDRRRRVLILKSEGVKMPTATLKERVDARLASEHHEIDSRVTVLGHVVRGGTTWAFDRLLAVRLANAAVRGLFDGRSGFMAGWVGPGVTTPPCPYDPYVVLVPLAEMLAETEKLHRGESALAMWRKRVYREVESVLER
ncbi:MAG TPA: 6-phosphofructokinase [Polyangiaceae bacterium]|nr:6-phosphofructokinase [Polyangiaceae bacterium]